MSTAGKLDINFHADEKDLIKAQARVIKQLDEAISKYKKFGKEGKEAGKDNEKAMERFVAAVKKANASPFEKQRETMAKLKQAVDSGKLSVVEYNAAVKRMAADQRAAFSGNAIKGVGAMAAGLLAAKGVVGQFSQVLEAVQEQMAEFAEKQRESTPSLGKLAQLSQGDPDTYRNIVSEAKKTFLEGGTETYGEALDVQFSLNSASVEKYRRDVSKLLGTQLVSDATPLINAAAALDAALGEKEVGSFRQIVSKSLGASGGSPAEAERILAATAKTGGAGRTLGMSDEELLAGVATVSKISGADEAGTQVKALLKQIDKFGIQGGFLESGKSLREQVVAIQSQLDRGANIYDVLGDRDEGIQAFRTLSNNLDKFDQNFRNVNDAQSKDLFGEVVKVAMAQPQIAADLLRRQGLAKKEFSYEREATYSTVADALQADMIADLRSRGRGPVKAYFANKWFSTFRMRGDERFVDTFEEYASPETKMQLQQLRGNLEGALEETTQAMKETAQELRGEIREGRTNAARSRQATAGGAVEAR